MEHGIIIERVASVNILEQCAEMYPGAYNTEPWNDSWTSQTATALLTCYYHTPQFMGWIARQGNQIIGCAIGNVEPYYSGNIFILKEVFVAVNTQGLGVGSRLMASLKDDLQKVNIKMIILSTHRPIFNFYAKSGFKEMEGVGTMVYAYN
jgi:aminoglycoside 6'-N-acetyltransferase I